MAVRGDITKDKDFFRILAWIDQKRYWAYATLAFSFLVSLGWTLGVSFLLSRFFLVVLSSSSLQGIRNINVDPKTKMAAFLSIAGFLVLCGAGMYFLRATARKKSLDNDDWNKVIRSDWYESTGRGSLLDFLHTGTPFVSPYQHFAMAMFGLTLVFMGPGIFVYPLIDAHIILETRRDDFRRRSAILILQLFRLSGVSIDIESHDAEGLGWGEKMIFFAKMQKMRWICLSDDLTHARLESDMDSKIRAALGYR